MDYERKYKLALERAQTMQENSNGMILKKWLWSVFPELKESEDEKIKREIVAYINELADLKNEKIHTKWLDWLEKQGEKKPADKVEPKFNVGDWITDGRLTCKVLGVTGKSYELHLYNDDYCHFETDIQSVDKYYRLWTIEDAKDGDVLNSPSHRLIWIYNDNEYYHVCINMNYGTIDIATYGLIKIPSDACPATKDERTILFSKMKEEGYEWDTDKKELKKIEPKKLDANKVINWVNPDKVIEWLKNTIRQKAENYGVYKETRLVLPYNSIEDLINDFKEDFGL